MYLEISGVIAIYMAALWVTFSAGWRRALLSAVFWWTLGAVVYTLLPLAYVMSMDDYSTPAFTVSKDSVVEYVLYTGAISLAFAIGWRAAWGATVGPKAGLFRTLELSMRRLMWIEVAGLVLTLGGAMLSGISPLSMLTTVSGEGYSYYEQGEFRLAILTAIGRSLIALAAPVMLLIAARSPVSRTKWLAAANYMVVLSLLILTGVRGHLLEFLSLTLLLFVVMPPLIDGRLKPRVGIVMMVPLVIVAFARLAIWMQNARGYGEDKAMLNLTSLAEVGRTLNLLTPSAGIFEWVKSNGFGPGVSLRDAIIQSPPSFIIPVQERAEFLQIVDIMNAPARGAAVTSAAELYYNAGWVLGALVLLLFGYALGRLQNRGEQRQDALTLLILLSLGPAFLQVFTRGYLWATVVSLIGSFVYPWIFVRLAGGHSRPMTHERGGNPRVRRRPEARINLW